MQNTYKQELLLTIRCFTYNHEPYIRQCLEGFVMQKTNFRFEAIIHDDASIDGTARIIQEYANKYPDLIKPILEIENQYSKHDGSLYRIMNEHIHGKYVAMCEGDDYWTDPYKLQKQVDFLESHEDHTLCFHNAIEHWDKGEYKDSLFVKNINQDRDYSGYEILKTWIIPTTSVIFRRYILETELYKKAMNERRFIYGDIVLFLTNAEFGKLHYLNENMAVYRRHKGGAVYKKDISYLKELPLHYSAILNVFGRKYRFLKPEISRIYFNYVFEAKKRKEYTYLIKALFLAFTSCPMYFIGRAIGCIHIFITRNIKTT